MFSIGDIVEIIDGAGGSMGNKGDIASVIEIEGNFSGTDTPIVNAKLLSGKDKGKVSARFIFRYKLYNTEWDK